MLRWPETLGPRRLEVTGTGRRWSGRVGDTVEKEVVDSESNSIILKPCQTFRDSGTFWQQSSTFRRTKLSDKELSL